MLLNIPQCTAQTPLTPQKCLSRVQVPVTPGTVAHQAPLSVGVSRQEHWGGLPCLPPGDLPDPGMKPGSPVSCMGRRILDPLSQEWLAQNVSCVEGEEAAL